MQFDRRHILAAGFAALCSLGSGQALAQAAWPAKAITVVVAYPPGGDTDAIARLFADKLSQKLKQTVLVDNKPGAGGTIGNAFVGRAPADGYTLLFTPNPFTTAPMVMNLSPSASYDVLNGFEPIIKIATQPLVLVAHPGAGVKSIAEMVTSAKGGKALSYASPGAGSPMHVVAEWLNRSAGVKIQHVPYRGVGPSVTDVVAGHVNTAWSPLARSRSTSPRAACSRWLSATRNVRRSPPLFRPWRNKATRMWSSAHGTGSSRPRARRPTSCACSTATSTTS